MAYRDDVTALSARHDALAAEVAQKTRELEESRRLLEHAQERARLPVLDQIRVASPCTASWNEMTGDDRTRHCGACQKSVYNLSDMTRAEAEALIIERNGELCVRYYQRADGTILLADCTVGVQRVRDRWRTTARAAALVAGGLAAAGAAGLYARATEPPCAIPRDDLSRRMVVGALKPPPPPPPAPPAPTRDRVPQVTQVTMGAIAVPFDPPPHAPRPHAQPAPTRDQVEVDSLFPPPPEQTPGDPPSAPERPRFELDHEPVVGATRSLTWEAPRPSQPAAPATRERPAAAGKRAR
jgi:hypothetical protein